MIGVKHKKTVVDIFARCGDGVKIAFEKLCVVQEANVEKVMLQQKGFQTFDSKAAHKERTFRRKRQHAIELEFKIRRGTNRHESFGKILTFKTQTHTSACSQDNNVHGKPF